MSGEIITNDEMRLRKLAMLVEQMRDKQTARPVPANRTRSRRERAELESRVDLMVAQVLDRKPKWSGGEPDGRDEAG